MKVYNSENYSFANRAQTASPVARADDSASFATMLAGKTKGMANSIADSAEAKQMNFTNMSRQEIRDWVNEEIKSGKMTLDESSPLMLMSMKIPVGGSVEDPAAGDSNYIDFKEKARLGIDGALVRGDRVAAKRLEAALDIMMKQERTIGFRQTGLIPGALSEKPNLNFI